MASLSGAGSEIKESSKEEEDLKARSSKKSKGGDHVFVEGRPPPVSYADLDTDNQKKRTFKETVLGLTSDLSKGDEPVEEASESQMGEPEEVDEFGSVINIKIVEKKVGDYECPSFLLSNKERIRIQRPWKGGLIVKLLGRKIGFKALENRLNQLWVKAGVITIIDLGNDFFLVTFTSEKDRDHALQGGPWMIYDHYFVIREWSPNFEPARASIDKVAAWVRFSGLPIEYYDPFFLSAVGDRIGKTIKVDKNTLLRERGKYARLCVEIDLSKPLLAMFEVQEKCYKVEYEGLHMLCLTCGKFGHYRDGCSATKQPTEGVLGNDQQPGIQLSQQEVWSVVQKQRRARKGKEVPENGHGVRNDGVNTESNSRGSRFNVLGVEKEIVDDADVDAEILVKRDNFLIEKVKSMLKEMHAETSRKQKSQILRTNNVQSSTRNNKVVNDNSSTVVALEKEKTETRGNLMIGATDNKVIKERINHREVMGDRNNGSQLVQSGTQTNAVNTHVNSSGINEVVLMDHSSGPVIWNGLNNKPPDQLLSAPPNFSNDVGNVQEEFMDATDIAASGNDDSDMEIVEETPIGVVAGVLSPQ